MLEKAIELLNIFYDNGYDAYIVGGFVRDYIIGKESNDIDIATNATPMQIKNIFSVIKIPFEKYGSVHLNYKNISFEITTFRKEFEYKNKRLPSKIVYTSDLLEDLKRRDFTMNTLCIDKSGNILDLLNAKDDIKNKIIKVIGDANVKFSEDALRILRAIRFACQLNFKLDDKLKESIIINRSGLLELSYFRKKQELNKIFSSNNSLYGISLLKDFELDKYLEIKIPDRIVKTTDPIGMWYQMSPCDRYEFTNNEKDYINKLKIIVSKNEIDDMSLYKYGNYICHIASQILSMNEVKIYDRYDKLRIHKASDINISVNEIIEILNLKDKSLIKKILSDLEEKIINKKLENEVNELKQYLIETYL